MLEIKDISVQFASNHSVQAVENVNLCAKEKEKVVIVGETGSGKSILLLAILGLLPQNAIVTGEVLFEGKNLLKLKRKEWDEIRGKKISYVPQGSGNGMNPLLNVGFQVGEPLLEHRKTTKKKAFQKSIELLKKFHIGNEEIMAKQYPHTYSGGMRQRSMIAMGISAGAQIILADEPTKGLDEKRVAMVAESFQMLEDETILCVTHDLNFAKKIAQSISVMYAANQVEYAAAEEILNHPLHPYTQDMIAAMPENGLKVSKGFAIAHEQYGLGGCRYAPRCRMCKERCIIQQPPMINCKGHKVRCWNYVD